MPKTKFHPHLKEDKQRDIISVLKTEHSLGKSKLPESDTSNDNIMEQIVKGEFDYSVIPVLKIRDKKTLKNLKMKFKAVFILHALGDTIGFKNGEWEFNNWSEYIPIESTNQLLYEFINLGGINAINLKDWYVSDDTVFHIATGKIMLKYETGITNSLIDRARQEMSTVMKNIAIDYNSPRKINRYVGLTMEKYIKLFGKKTDASLQPYDNNSGGNGCAMRTACIGLCFLNNNIKSDLNKLFDLSVRLSTMTHNSPIGYLAGFNAAFFVYLGIHNVPIAQWPLIFLDFLSDIEIIKKITEQIGDNFTSQEHRDYNAYLENWRRYLTMRFDNNKPITIKTHSNTIARFKFYYENFVKGRNVTSVGASGYCCMIMAYDCLLDCNGAWEKLVIYSMLHPGDGDSVGSVAASLYGSVYGFGDVPNRLLKNLEFKNDLLTVSKELFKKYATV